METEEVAVSRTNTRDSVHQLALRHALSEQELAGDVEALAREYTRLEGTVRRVLGGAFALALAAAGALGGAVSLATRSQTASAVRDERLRLLEGRVNHLEVRLDTVVQDRRNP